MLFTKNLPILMYHHVSEKNGLVTLPPLSFRRQMQWLAEKNWKTLTDAEMEYFYQGGRFPRKSVMLTFDDDWLDNWFQVFPVLQEFNLHAHIFLITDQVGECPVQRHQSSVFSHKDCEYQVAVGNVDIVMLRWSEVRAMAESGLVEFYHHTYPHTRWDRVSVNRDIQNEMLTADIILSREKMKEKTGHCSKHLCWPEGYYNRDYIWLANSLGFSYLYTTERRMNAVRNGPLSIGRISTKERESLSWLVRRLFYYTTPGFSSLLALYRGPRVEDE
ncbi:polysaccharide deacetylase family protein [Escherichia coli]|uniref:polysaccharide deacetylase family protein n=1 Tax=Escherichia coli TaxID=562 RepID=UPI000A188525|nr:polysaccharide deacetylase family protein [Escherichia coli]OSL96428.1 putative carbohydrate transport protein [Escherichia coli T426]